MAAILKPSNLSLTWASGGDVLNPGDTKYATGWQVEIPPRQWFNYLDNRQDSAIAHINQRGVAAWDNTTEYQEDKSYVQGVTNGTIYRCVQTHGGAVGTSHDPETDVTNTYWIIAFASAGDFYTKAEVDSAFLARAANGGDIQNVATFRNNISVYSQAQTYTRTEVDARTTVASTAQAQAGTSNTTLITPLRLTEWSQSKSLGIGQTWQDVSAGRVSGVTYTNTTGRPIQLGISYIGGGGADSVTFYINGEVMLNESNVAGSCVLYINNIIPAGVTYRFDIVGSGGVLNKWMELR